MSGNPKGDLIARVRALGRGELEFAAQASGPGHEPRFAASVRVGGAELARGEGRSRREAERAASEAALRVLDGEGEGGEPEGAGEQHEQHGPPQRWPVYAEVLAQALIVAHERSENGTLEAVQRDAAALYRGLLSALGVPPKGEA